MLIITLHVVVDVTLRFASTFIVTKDLVWTADQHLTGARAFSRPNYTLLFHHID